MGGEAVPQGDPKDSACQGEHPGRFAAGSHGMEVVRKLR
jgi:hypothetical protein